MEILTNDAEVIKAFHVGDIVTFGADPMEWRVVQCELVNEHIAFRVEPIGEHKRYQQS